MYIVNGQYAQCAQKSNQYVIIANLRLFSDRNASEYALFVVQLSSVCTLGCACLPR